MTLLPRLAVFACVWLSIACGSDDGTAGPAGVDRSANVASISPSELGALCDWANGRLGGYGRTENCSDGRSFHTFASQAACVAHPFPMTCNATVGQYEDCITAVVGKTSSLCAVTASLPPACQVLAPMCTIVFG